jgi:hypothetical protein
MAAILKAQLEGLLLKSKGVQAGDPQQSEPAQNTPIFWRFGRQNCCCGSQSRGPVLTRLGDILGLISSDSLLWI